MLDLDKRPGSWAIALGYRQPALTSNWAPFLVDSVAPKGGAGPDALAAGACGRKPRCQGFFHRRRQLATRLELALLLVALLTGLSPTQAQKTKNTPNDRDGDGIPNRCTVRAW